MSKNYVDVCDQCDKESKDANFLSKGWIHFEHMELRYSNGEAFLSKNLNQMDFCSIKCFQKWLNNL